MGKAAAAICRRSGSSFSCTDLVHVSLGISVRERRTTASKTISSKRNKREASIGEEQISSVQENHWRYPRRHAGVELSCIEEPSVRTCSVVKMRGIRNQDSLPGERAYVMRSSLRKAKRVSSTLSGACSVGGIVPITARAAVAKITSRSSCGLLNA